MATVAVANSLQKRIMTSCETTTNTIRPKALRRRLSLNLIPMKLNPADLGPAWSDGPLSASVLPDFLTDWTRSYHINEISHENALNEKPIKRRRTEESTDPQAFHSELSEQKLCCFKENGLISCSELAALLSLPSSSDNSSTLPLILDLRSLSAQSCLRIQNAVGMPCESRVKLRLALPNLDQYLRNGAIDETPTTTVANDNKLVVICTDFVNGAVRGSDNLINSLIMHLQRNHRVTVRVLQGGFREFRRSYPHLCEKPAVRKRGVTSPENSSLKAPVSTSCPQYGTSPDSEQAGGQAFLSNGTASDEKSCTNYRISYNQLLLPGLSLVLSSTYPNECDERLATDRPFTGSPEDDNSTKRSASLPYLPTNPLYSAFSYNDEFEDTEDVFRARASQILPFLYLGNEIDGTSEQILTTCNIRSVLNVTTKVPFLDETRFRCRRLPASDLQSQDLRPLFTSAFQFIEEARCSGTAVLVHCQAGVSRSPSLVIAYLMAHSRLSLRDAYQLVKSKRSVISPNFAFLGQLCEFEADLTAGRAERKPDTLISLIPDAAFTTPLSDDLVSITTSISSAGEPMNANGGDGSEQTVVNSIECTPSVGSHSACSKSDK
ncbi:unnamed protein product [Calicophoron daubneyi]|uniref:protein-tyrosine-phosphatase n=1 Tax=Calicophoron daubneyi TaxID=300641 RepID=A0AAV2TJZ3_CALDB